MKPTPGHIYTRLCDIIGDDSSAIVMANLTLQGPCDEYMLFFDQNQQYAVVDSDGRMPEEIFYLGHSRMKDVEQRKKINAKKDKILLPTRVVIRADDVPAFTDEVYPWHYMALQNKAHLLTNLCVKGYSGNVTVYRDEKQHAYELQDIQKKNAKVDTSTLASTFCSFGG